MKQTYRKPELFQILYTDGETIEIWAFRMWYAPNANSEWIVFQDNTGDTQIWIPGKNVRAVSKVDRDKPGRVQVGGVKYGS